MRDKESQNSQALTVNTLVVAMDNPHLATREFILIRTYLILCCHCMGEVSGTVVPYRQVLSLLISEVAVHTDWPLAIGLL